MKYREEKALSDRQGPKAYLPQIICVWRARVLINILQSKKEWDKKKKKKQKLGMQRMIAKNHFVQV